MNKKLFWLAFWVVGFAVWMTCMLLYFKYQAVFTSLQRDRVLMVASEIDAIAEKNLSLGQDFWEIATLQDVIVRRRAADMILIDIDVIGAEGKIAYSTDLAKLGTAIDADWLTLFAKSQNATSVSGPSPNKEFAIVASPIRNSFNQLAGYAVIRYSRDVEHAAMGSFTKRLIYVGSGIFIFFTLILFLTLIFFKNRVEQQLKHAAELLKVPANIAIPVRGALAAEMMAVNTKIADANWALTSITSAAL